MKLSLFLILLFAVIISLCGCTPPASGKRKCEAESSSYIGEEQEDWPDEEKSASGKLKHPRLIQSAIKQAGQPSNTDKHVSFNTEVDVCRIPSPSYEGGIFWLHEKVFKPMILDKCDLFLENSAEIDFVAVIHKCIIRNYGMFHFFYRSAEQFSNFDSYLCQIEKNIGGKIILFPRTTGFVKVKDSKECFEEAIICLLDQIIPAYEINEHLLNLVLSMNKTTKIDRKYLAKLTEEFLQIASVYDSCVRVFATFPLKEYMQGIHELRRTINHLEHNAINLHEALERLKQTIPKLIESTPRMNDTLTAAGRIDFQPLVTATKSFYSYVKIALKVDGASSSK